MTDLLTQLNSLKRPRLLINAARHGMSDYKRDTHLPRYLGAYLPRDGTAVLTQLMSLEADLDLERQARAASYSVAHHVEIMIAIMNEARQLRQSPSAMVSDQAMP